MSKNILTKLTEFRDAPTPELESWFSVCKNLIKQRHKLKVQLSEIEAELIQLGVRSSFEADCITMVDLTTNKE